MHKRFYPAWCNTKKKVLLLRFLDDKRFSSRFQKKITIFNKTPSFFIGRRETVSYRQNWNFEWKFRLVNNSTHMHAYMCIVVQNNLSSVTHIRCRRYNRHIRVVQNCQQLST